MCGYFCIGFIDFMLKDKRFLDHTNLFSHNEYEKNDKIILQYWKFEKPEISYLLEKTLVLSIICSKEKNEDETIFKEEESIEISKVLGLIENV